MDTHARALARELLDDAVRQLPNVSRLVAVPAQFHIARVLAAWSREEARELLVPAIPELAELFAGNHRLDVLVNEALVLTAATAPELMESLPQLPGHLRRFVHLQLFRAMVEHGHAEAACDYLISFEDSAEFPHTAVGMILQQAVSEEKRLALARRAVHAWRYQPRRDPSIGHGLPRTFDYLRSFTSIWRILPRAEAVDAAQELVDKVRTQKDFHMSGSIGERVKFTSGRQFQFFELFEALQELDPHLAHALVKEQPELAAAVAVYPLGQRSVRESYANKAAERKTTRRRGWIVGGSGDEDIQFGYSLLDSYESMDFSEPIRLASRKLREELQGNAAPKEVWASTQAFRQILYSAGKFLGEHAVNYSDEISDPEIRILARIELAARLAGLPECLGNRAWWPKPGTTTRSPGRHGF